MNELESLEMTIMAKILKMHEDRISTLEKSLVISLAAISSLQDEIKVLKGAK